MARGCAGQPPGAGRHPGVVKVPQGGEEGAAGPPRGGGGAVAAVMLGGLRALQRQLPARPFLWRMLKDGHPGFKGKRLLSPSSARTGNQFPPAPGTRRGGSSRRAQGSAQDTLRLSCKRVLLLLSAPVTNSGADLGEKEQTNKTFAGSCSSVAVTRTRAPCLTP